MYDRARIVPGLVLFLAIAGLPFWWSLATGAAPRVPQIEKPAGQARCIEDTATMRRGHMQLLAAWRDEVVRDGQRTYVASDGRRFRKSLTGTCLQCHADKRASCDRCHGWLDVHPACWDCHVETGGRR